MMFDGLPFVRIKTQLLNYAYRDMNESPVLRVYPEDEGNDLEGYFYDGKISGAECEHALLRAYDSQVDSDKRMIDLLLNEAV